MHGSAHARAAVVHAPRSAPLQPDPHPTPHPTPTPPPPRPTRLPRPHFGVDPRLSEQLIAAKLSPFNNRWFEPYNFTPAHGDVGFLPRGTPPSSLLRRIDGHYADLWRHGASESLSLYAEGPVPLSTGTRDACSEEQAFLLILPPARPSASHWARELAGLVADARSPPCALLRSKEYGRVPLEFARRLLSALEPGRAKNRLVDSACGGPLVGMHLAGAGVHSLLRARVASTVRAGETLLVASDNAADCAHMCDVFFEAADSGHAMG